MVARRCLTPIELVPMPQVGAPTMGAWRIGTLACDAVGSLWRCTSAGSPGIWVEVGGGAAVVGFVAGDLKPWAAASIPAGWLDCDGSAVSRTTFSELFAVIGTTWGAGDSSTTFALPDFRRRGLVGAGGTATAMLGNTVGSRGGAETHILTVGEMPSHSHSAPVYPARVPGVTAFAARDAFSSDSYGNATTNPTGGGSAHNNLPPSAVVRWLIKV